MDAARSNRGWFGKSLRKAHVMYKTPDWGALKGQAFDARQFADDLVLAGIEVIEFHAKDQDGICYFQTERGPFYGQDLWAEMTTVLRPRGIRLIGYYNTTLDSWVGENHPEWLCRSVDGQPRTLFSPYPHVCLRNPGYWDYALGLMEEFVSGYEVDGLWLDILGFPNTYASGNFAVGSGCYCDVCRRAYEEEFGEPLPEKSDDPEVRGRVYLFAKRQRSAFLGAVSELLHRHRPDAVLVSNHSGEHWDAMGEPPEFLGYTDVNSMEAHAPRHLIQIMKAKYMRSQPKDFEILTPGSWWGWAGWNMKPAEMLAHEAALISANGATTTVGVQPLPDGRVDSDELARMGEAFATLRTREPYLVGAETVRDILLLHSHRSEWIERTHMRMPRSNLDGMGEALIRHGLHFDIRNSQTAGRSAERSRRSLEGYRLVIVSDQVCLEDELVEALRDHVRRGGNLLLTGRTGLLQPDGQLAQDFGLADLMGVHFEAFAPYNVLYARPLELGKGTPRYPMMLGAPVAQVRCEGATPIGHLVFPEEDWAPDRNVWPWPSANPHAIKTDWPFATVNRVGAARVGYCPAIFGQLPETYPEKAEVSLRRVMVNLVDLLLGQRLVEIDGPGDTHIVVTRQPGRVMVNVLELRASHEFEAVPIDATPWLASTTLRLNTDRFGRPRHVFLAGRNEDLPWEQDGHWINVSLPVRGAHTLVICETSDS